MPSKAASGPRKRGAAGPLPKHQNSFAFKHNPHSRITEAIAAIPATAGCCPKCTSIIEWRRKYRKYKPLSKPRKCTGCQKMTLRLAYHALCGECTGERGVCAKCGVGREEAARQLLELEELTKQIDLLANTKGSIPGFTERERRSMLRELLKERANLMELDPDDAAEESEAMDKAAVAAESGKSKLKGDIEERGAGGGALSSKASENVGGDSEKEEEMEGDDNIEGSGDDGEEEEEEQEEEDEKAAPIVKSKVHSAGGTIRPGAFGSSPDDVGLVDPSIFSRALKEAQRRAKELGM